jgi:hypothetical protein
MKGLMRTALWTELLEAMRADYPDVKFNDPAGHAVSRVIRSNADFMFELSEENTKLKEPKP